MDCTYQSVKKVLKEIVDCFSKQRFFEQTKDTLDLSKVSFLYKETSRNDIIDKTEIERSRNIMEKKYKCPCCGYYTFDHELDEL